MTIVLYEVKPSICFQIADAFSSGEVCESENEENRFDVKIEDAEVQTIGENVVVLRNLKRPKEKPLFIARTQFDMLLIK